MRDRPNNNEYVKYDNFHAKILHNLRKRNKANSAIYKENPPHLNDLLLNYAKKEEHKIVKIVTEAINTVLQNEVERLPHKDQHPFDPNAVGLAAIIFTTVTDVVWAYLAHTDLGIDLKKTDDFWEQSLVQQLFTFVTATVTMPLVMLAIAKKYQLDLREAVRVAATVGFATIISVVPFNLFVKYGPELLKALGVKEYLADTLSFLFPGIAEGPLQAIALVLGNLVTDRNYIFDKIEFAIAVSPLSWIFGTAWQGALQGIEALKGVIPEPYLTVFVALGVPVADTLALYASLLMINAATDHVKVKFLDAIFQNPKIITEHPLYKSEMQLEERVADITREALDVAENIKGTAREITEDFKDAIALPMPNLLGILRQTGSPLHQEQQTSTLDYVRDLANNAIATGYNRLRNYWSR